MIKNFIPLAKKIRWVFSDCDGVLTDGGVYYSANGEELKRFHIPDGMGVERLRDLGGIQTAFMTGEHFAGLKKRAEKLKIEALFLGCKKKWATLQEFCREQNISPEEIAFIGDDVNDLEVMQNVGLSACPSNAVPEIKAIANFVCEKSGGLGAFREFAEWLLICRRQ